MERPVPYRGGRLTVVYAVRGNGSSPGADFYEHLNDRDKAKLNKLFQWIGEHGWINNSTKFKPIEGSDFFEFKSFQIRMPCYRVGGLMIITHGFFKKADALPRREIERAKRFRLEDESVVRKAEPKPGRQGWRG